MLRGGSGALVAGYKTALREPQAGEYSVTRLAGRQVAETSSLVATFPRPAEPLVVYEFDACPFCKKVREMASYLDLDILFKPAPQGGPTFRPEGAALRKAQDGKAGFPFLVDPNTGVQMGESDDIIAYLAKTYGNGEVPLMLRLGVLTALTAGLCSLPRAGRGARYRPARMPEQPLVLWGYESSPFVRLVKERLCELELPHVMRNCARGSPKRQEVFDAYGKFQVPFLQVRVGWAAWDGSRGVGAGAC